MNQPRLPCSCHVNIILVRITFSLGSRLNPFKRIQLQINSNSVKLMLVSLATIKLCRGCFNWPTVEHSFSFVYISLIPSWRRSGHTLDAFIYSIIVSLIILLRVTREPNYLCSQCWVHFVSSRGEGVRDRSFFTRQGGLVEFFEVSLESCMTPPPVTKFFPRPPSNKGNILRDHPFSLIFFRWPLPSRPFFLDDPPNPTSPPYLVKNERSLKQFDMKAE